MAGAALLLMVGVAAIAVLIACLRAFGCALEYRRTRAFLLRVDETSAGRPFRKVREPLPSPRNAGPANHTTLTPGGISKNTAAFVGLALLLGSRSADFDKQARKLLQPHPGSNTGEGGAASRSRKATASNRTSTERSATQHARSMFW